MKKTLSIIFSAALILPLFSRAAIPGDEHWDPQFNLPGTTNYIFAIAVNGGKVYAGGYTSAGFVTNAALEVWDGLQWTMLSYFTGSGTPIQDMMSFGGALYVAGSFNTIDGVPIKGLAKWDGSSWSSMGINGTVASLTTDGVNLYAGGAFTNADMSGTIMTNIGYWDGSAWHAMGGGLGQPGYGAVRAIALQSGTVYAGGFFTNAGSQLITNLSVWNGASWSSVGGGVQGVQLNCLALNGTDLYVGGIFTTAGSILATNLARWDGANWWPVGGGLAGSGSGVNSIGIFNGSVCAAGSFTNAAGLKVSNFVIWDGTSWSTAGGGINNSGYRILNNGTNLYVGGKFSLAGNKLMNGIASWDGVNWNPIGTAGQINGISLDAWAMAGDGTNIFAGGPSLSFAYVAQTNVNLIARFDGTNWYPLGSGITGPSGVIGPIGTSIFSLVATNNRLYAGGYFTSAGGAGVANIAKWDGTNWYSMGNPGGAVADILIQGDGVYAAGAPFYSSTLFGAAFFSRWDGTNWNGALGFPPYTDWTAYFADANFGMAALAAVGTNIYVGGHFSIGQYADTNTFSRYTNCNNILRFDGTYGWIVGTGLNSNVTCMTVLGTNLYVAGTFTNAGGIAASKIAMWSGTYWTNLGSGLVGSGTIYGLTAVGNYIYAGGSFTNMGGTSVNHIARWDGTNWSGLGNGTTYPGLSSGTVYSLASSGSDLYVSGTFRMSGNKNSFNMGRWNDQINFDTPKIGALSTSNGVLRMRLSAITGRSNVVQASTNLVNWTPILTNSVGIYDFTDPNSSSYPLRFYRAALSL